MNKKYTACNIKKLIENNSRNYKIEYNEIEKSHQKELQEPIFLEGDKAGEYDHHKIVDYKTLYTAKIEDGLVFGPGIIFTPDMEIVDDAVPKYDMNTTIDKTKLKNGEIPLPKTNYIDGKVFVMSSVYEDYYYHWLYNCIPKYSLLKNHDFDYIYVRDEKKFQKEYLDILGIDRSKIISANDGTLIQAKELVFTSFFNFSSERILKILRNYIQVIEQKFETEQISADLKKYLGKDIELNSNLRLYISRDDAFQNRNLINEKELLDFLEPEGFIKLELTKIPVYLQILLFANASFIIGPHGAGLGNIVFAPRHTKFIEIYNPSYVHPCMWIQSAYQETQYAYIFGKGVRNLEEDFIVRRLFPMELDIEKFKRLYGVVRESSVVSVDVES